MLQVRDLDVAYGRIEALHSVHVELSGRGIVTVIGRNGAGKSTLLGALSGMIKPKAGTILFDGKPVPPAPHKAVAAGIVHVPAGRRIFPSLTVEENLLMGGFRARSRELPVRKAEVFRVFPLLEERARQRAGTLSGGEQQMLALGRALMSDPKIMLLDEPSLGLAPLMSGKVFDLIRRINSERGIGILLVEQNARKALSIADYAYVLENGRVVLEGPASSLACDPRVEEAYLGKSKC